MGGMKMLHAATDAHAAWTSAIGQSPLPPDTDAPTACGACLDIIPHLISRLNGETTEIIGLQTDIETLDSKDKKGLKELELALGQKELHITRLNAWLVPLLSLQVLISSADGPSPPTSSAGQTGANLDAATRAATSVQEYLITSGTSSPASFHALLECLAATVENKALTQTQIDNIMAPIGHKIRSLLSHTFAGTCDATKVSRILSVRTVSLALLMIVQPSSNATGSKRSNTSLTVDQVTGDLVTGDRISRLTNDFLDRNDIQARYTGASMVEGLRLFALIFEKLDPSVHDAILKFTISLDILCLHLTKRALQQLGAQDDVIALNAIFRLVDAILQHFAYNYHLHPTTFDVGFLNPLICFSASGNLLNSTYLTNETHTAAIDAVAAFRTIRTAALSKPLGNPNGQPKPTKLFPYKDATDANGTKLGFQKCQSFLRNVCKNTTQQKDIAGTKYTGCLRSGNFCVHQP